MINQVESAGESESQAPVVAVLGTMDTNREAIKLACDALEAAGSRPTVWDFSLRPHAIPGADVTGDRLVEVGGSDWESVGALTRAEAGAVMIRGAADLLSAEVASGRLQGGLGIGGANGTSMACGVMREMPLLFPKVMVSVVASTAAVQWYVGGSDIVMFPSVGDISSNRITDRIIDNAARSVSAMARGWMGRDPQQEVPPLVGISSFGGTAGCVDRVEQRLREAGREVIMFHASGPGGRALEKLAGAGDLSGVVDVTTHELIDLVVGGVYSAGEQRLRAAGETGLPQVIVPGALDHSNFWVGQVPEQFKEREFFQFNEQNLLMRTNAPEYEALGRLMAQRINAASGPVAVLIPTRGFSEHTSRQTFDLEGNPVGHWHQPQADARLAEVLSDLLEEAPLRRFDLHINDPEFADICADTFLEMADAGQSARSLDSQAP
ncbi:MAG: Tm-1-like ATP-binding domain-containing protein [Acidimicrobiia bacterium]